MEEIAVLDTGYEDYSQEQRLFSENGYRLKIFDGSARDLEEKISFASGATGILVRSSRIDREFLDRMPRLKAIVRYGTGYDNIDLAAAAGRGIRVANVQGYADHAVSDHALALMFACVRNLSAVEHHSRKHRPSDEEQPSAPASAGGEEVFGKPGRKEVFELHDKTLGIIGIGRIGSQFASKAGPLFERIIAFDPYKEAAYMKEFGAEKTSFGDLLQRSHVISLHCSLTHETRHLLDVAAFGQMKNRPVIINTSRGPVMDERALLTALEEGKVHSAGLDVFETEPPGEKQQALLNHSRVAWTPHIAWYSDCSMRELQRRAAANMIALLTGGEAEDEVKC